MARKQATFTASDGRDAGKQFLIREMPATQSESWAIRVMLAIGHAGIEIPETFRQQGLAGLVAILQGGFEGNAELESNLLTALKMTLFTNLMRIEPATALPLLDEMMGCVQRVESSVTRDLIEDDIEEVSTRMKLRLEIWNLHTDFFPDAGQSTSESGRPADEQGSWTIKTPPSR